MSGLRFCIVGCGLIGHKRAKALGGGKLVVCADLSLPRAQTLAKGHDARATENWQGAVASSDVDVVIIATPHDALAAVVRASIEAGKHVLVEKPAARNPAELHGLQALAQAKGVCVRVGFNHRYHRAFQKAREIVDSGVLGAMMFVRARYGHGGRIGYDKEWRADPKLSGGGELIDQGVHLIDLARWFLGDFAEVNGFAHTYFWDMPVDDNGFMLLKTAQNQTAFLHASCTEWKNTFSFEIYGKTGKLHIEGLGGSYGVERLSHYAMQPEMGPPPTTVYEYPMGDNSWDVEMAEFQADIAAKRSSSPGLQDAVAALDVVQKIYQLSGFDAEGRKTRA